MKHRILISFLMALCLLSLKATANSVDPIHEILKKNIGSFRGVEATYGQFCRVTLRDYGGYVYAGLEVQIEAGEHPEHSFEQNMYHSAFEDLRDWNFSTESRKISFTANDDSRVDFQLDSKSEKIIAVSLIQADGNQLYQFWCNLE